MSLVLNLLSLHGDGMRSRGSWIRMAVLALVWGSSFLWIKIALRNLSPAHIAFGRLALGTLALLVLILGMRGRLPRDRRIWLYMLVPAIFGSAVPFLLFGIGEQTVDSGVAGVLNATTPLWVLVFALLIRVERRPAATRTAGLMLGFAGTLLIFAPWQANGLASWGALACLAAAICYGVSFAFIAKYLAGRMSPIHLSLMQTTLGSAIIALALPFAGTTSAHLNAASLIAVTILGVCGTGIAYALNNRLIVDEGVTTAASVTYLMPVVSVLLGALALGEPLSYRVLIGMLVVLTGVALSQRRPAARPRDYTKRLSLAQRDSS